MQGAENRPGEAVLAPSVKNPPNMMDPTTTTATAGQGTEQDLRPRAKALSWMASMSVAAGQIQAAEAYLLELLAWCAFADRDVSELAADD